MLIHGDRLAMAPPKTTKGVNHMSKIFFDNQQMTKGERNRQVKDRAAFEREVARREAHEGVTTSNEDNLHFFKED